MRKSVLALLTATATTSAVGITSCGQQDAPRPAESGTLQIALTNAPADAGCLKITVAGSRTTTRAVDLAPGMPVTVNIDRLPVGIAQVSGEAFAAPCKDVGGASVPGWVSDAPVPIRIEAQTVARLVLKLIRNGRIGIDVDFEEGPSPMIVPVAPGVVTKDVLTVGDAAGTKPDGSPYRAVGLFDGMGGFDNGDGTFTVLANHEIGASGGIERAHGAPGSFVSRWTIRKSDLTPVKGEDLIRRVVTWNRATSSYDPPATGKAFGRFCAGELAPRDAFFDAASATGYDGRLYTSGEEIGAEGRAFAHALDGTSYELPRMGKYSFENVVPHPAAGRQTIVVGLDDSGGGQVYVYVGAKTNAGSPVERAGLTNGKLYGLKVTGVPMEDPATGAPAGAAFTLFELGNFENQTGAALEEASNANGVTKFQRPEDGAWNPAAPRDFYFVTTASFSTQSRLWRLRFADLANLAAGGTIDVLVDSASDGVRMMDNMTVEKGGRFVYLQEDPGGQDHLAKVWRYEIATDKATILAEHDPLRFAPGAARFLTRDEESSGIFDASDLLGPGWFLANVQAHHAHPDKELVEGGQLVAIYDPAAR
jgi:hypothetical protein